MHRLQRNDRSLELGAFGKRENMCRDESGPRLTHKAVESKSGGKDKNGKEERETEKGKASRCFNAESTQYFSIRKPETH